MDKKVAVFRKEHFNAAHRLFNANWSDEKNQQIFGKCANPNFHGHNYELILKVTGMDCDGCVKAVTRAATGAGTPPISVDLKSGEMRLPKDADVPAITRAIQRAGFGVAP